MLRKMCLQKYRILGMTFLSILAMLLKVFLVL